MPCDHLGHLTVSYRFLEYEVAECPDIRSHALAIDAVRCAACGIEFEIGRSRSVELPLVAVERPAVEAAPLVEAVDFEDLTT